MLVFILYVLQGSEYASKVAYKATNKITVVNKKDIAVLLFIYIQMQTLGGVL